MSPAQVALMTTITVLGTALFFGVPVLLLAYAVVLIRLRRKRALPRPLLNVSARMMALWLAAIVLFCGAAVIRLPRGYVAGWLAVGLMGLGSVAVLPLIRLRLGLPILPRLGWPLLICGLLLTVFAACDLHVAALAYTIGQYNNPNEAAVRAELSRNSNNAAARSSMAHIDISHGNYQDAAVQLQQLVKLEPDNEEAQFLLAHAQVRTGQRDAAGATLQRLAAQNDDWGRSARRMLTNLDHPQRRLMP